MRLLHRRAILLSPLLLIGLFASVSFAQDQDLRRLTVEDMLRLEAFGPVMFSPDGKWLAVEKQASAANTSHSGIDHERRFARSEVYLLQLSDKQLSLQSLDDVLSRSSRKRASENRYALIGWSPDGRNLALWSLREGHKLGVAVWTPANGNLHDYPGTVEPGFGNTKPRWISDHKLIFPVVTHTDNSRLGSATQLAVIERRRKAAFSGEAPSVSVYSTLGESIPINENEGELRVVNVRTKSISRIASGRFIDIAARAAGDAYAAIRLSEPLSGAAALSDERVMSMSGRRRGIVVITAGGEEFAKRPFPDIDAAPGTISWSEDGSSLLFIGYGGENLDRLAAYRYDLANDSLIELNTEGLALSGRSEQSLDRFYQTAWLDGEPVVLAAPESAGIVSTPDATAEETPFSQFVSGEASRLDVFSLGEAEPKRLTDWTIESVSRLIRPGDRDIVVIHVDGALWKLAANGQPYKLLGEAEAPVLAVLSTHFEGGDSPSLPKLNDDKHIVAMTLKDGAPILAIVNMDDGNAKMWPLLDPQAMPAAFSSAYDQAVFLERNGSAQSLVLALDDEPGTQKLLSLNDYLGEIRPPQLDSFTYTALDDREYTAWMILPDNYEKGQLYPTIVSVYPGLVQPPSQPIWGRTLISVPIANLQFFAANGFVVLMPSAPIPPYDPDIDPVVHIGDGVFPAMDRLVEMGIADPTRFVVTGQSGGGYATAVLLATSDRFKAGVATAGLYNLFNLHGHLVPEERNSETLIPGSYNGLDALVERGVMNMGETPWENTGRYIRNSPYFSVEKITAPILMIHGDLDFNYARAEQMYKALARLGRDATLLRYWGESHYVQNAVNVRDQWQRILSWLESRL